MASTSTYRYTCSDVGYMYALFAVFRFLGVKNGIRFFLEQVCKIFLKILIHDLEVAQCGQRFPIELMLNYTQGR